MVTFKSDQV